MMRVDLNSEMFLPENTKFTQLSLGKIFIGKHKVPKRMGGSVAKKISVEDGQELEIVLTR